MPDSAHTYLTDEDRDAAIRNIGDAHQSIPRLYGEIGSLQAELAATRAQLERSYVSNWWTAQAYLDRRLGPAGLGAIQP